MQICECVSFLVYIYVCKVAAVHYVQTVSSAS